MSIVQDATWAASPSTTRGLPTQLSVDPKGERIAYASNKSIFLRSIDHPEISKQYTDHTAQTTVARFSPSGFYVASGDASGSVRIWDCVGEGATKGEYHIISGRINDLAWDGDSQRIAAVGDGKERFGAFITADSGNSVGEVSGQSQQINCVSIRQQRPFRAATGSDDTTLAFYNGPPFKFSTSLRGPHSKYVYGTAFSPDGAHLISVGSDKMIWLYDGKTGEPKHHVGKDEHKGSVFSVSWSKDSKHVVTASADQTVKIWDVEADKAIHSWHMGEEGSVNINHQQMGVVWAHGRSDELIISVDLEGNLNYLSKDSPRPLRVVKGHQGNITAAVSSRNTPRGLWTGSFDGRVRNWDTNTGSASAVDGESRSNFVAGFASTPSAESKGRVYSIGWDDSLRTIDSSAQTFIGGASKVSGQPKGVAFSSSASQTLVVAANAIDVFSDGSKASTLQLQGFTATCIAAAPKTDLIAVGCDDKTVRLYTLAKDGLKHKSDLSDDALASAPSTLAFSHTGEHLAVGTSLGRICVFATNDGTLVTSRWSAHTSRVTSIDWSPDDSHAVSGSIDTGVFVWSIKAPGKRIKAGHAHKDGVNGVVWLEGDSGSAGKIISVGADAAAKTWKIEGLE